MTTASLVMGSSITLRRTGRGIRPDGSSFSLLGLLSLLRRPALAYGFDRAAIRFSVIVARKGRWFVDAFPDSDELTGADVATFSGGGELWEAKSDFCSASVLATGTGMTAGLFMSTTFTVRRNAICRAARKRRLSLNARGAGHGGHARPSP